MKKYAGEFLATFGLMFFGTGAAIVNSETNGAITHLGVAIMFGLIVMTMIYAFGDVSGSHMNPAVTLAFAFKKDFPWPLVFPYIISQACGAFLASYVLKIMFPASELLGATLPFGSVIRSFILEVILTFFLMFVVLQVATGSKEQGMFAGLAIGAFVLLEALFAGKISGASMNPIRSLAPAVVSGHLEHLWIYLTAPFIGALSAVGVYQILKS